VSLGSHLYNLKHLKTCYHRSVTGQEKTKFSPSFCKNPTANSLPTQKKVAVHLFEYSTDMVIFRLNGYIS